MKFTLALLVAATSAASFHKRNDLGVRFYSQIASDPIISSVGFDDWKADDEEEIVRYPVDHSAELDEEIVTSLGHTAAMEKKYGQWNYKKAHKK